MRQGIIQAVERFGKLHVDKTADRLTVLVGKARAQTLFTCERDRRGGEPVGVVVFPRPSTEKTAIIHVAVQPDYALRTPGAAGLGAVLTQNLKETASRIAGLQRILLFHRQVIILRVNA